jgi:hypothetical protein
VCMGLRDFDLYDIVCLLGIGLLILRGRGGPGIYLEERRCEA